MPTSAFISQAGLLPLRAFDSLGADYPRPNDPIIWTLSWCAGCGEGQNGLQAGAPAVSSTYSAANRAIGVPFEIAWPFLVRKVFWFNGVTATTDSADVGVYTEAGALVVSGGGTAISGANGTQEVDVTDTMLDPGRYWLAYAQNGVTATPFGLPNTQVNSRAMGLSMMNTAYVLPATYVPTAITVSIVPVCGIASRTLAS